MAGQVRREAYVMPTGYNCPKCKAFNRFALWVYAQWNIRIIHTCGCGQESALQAGRVIK